MSQEQSFKERVKNEIINCAKTYKDNFLDCEYLICSDAFHLKIFILLMQKKIITSR